MYVTGQDNGLSEVRLKNSEPLYGKQPQVNVDMQQLWKVMDDLGYMYDALSFDINAIITASSGYVTSITVDADGWITIDSSVPTEPEIIFNSGRVISYDLMLMGG